MQELGFWKFAGEHPHRVAIVDPDEQRCTFGELAERVNQLSHGLRWLGIGVGDAVTIVLPNGREFLEVWLAAMQLGVYLTPVNWHLTGPEVAHILADSGSRLLVAHERFAGAVRQAADEVELHLDQRIAVGNIDGFRPYDDLLRGQSSELPADRASGLPMLYTSGTTGRPKGVRRRLPRADPDTVSAMTGLLPLAFGDTPGEGVHLVAGPMYHAAPGGFAVGSFHAGHTLVLMDKWTPERTLELVERHHVTNTHLVPTMFHRLLALPDDARRAADVSSLRSVVHAAAPCPVETKRRMFAWLGPIIHEYYGGTEGLATVVHPDEWLAHPGTVGRAAMGAEVKIFDDDGIECPPGTAGTVWIKSPLTTFEYHNDADKTAANRRDDFITVGDIGYLDPDGWLFLCDRKADVIIAGGVNIYPAEIEAVLLEHEAVADVAVIGVPNDEWGEEVKAVVQPANGAATDELATELLTLCKGKLAAFKLPRTIDFRDSLPRHDTGKLARRLIRDEYWAGHETRI